LVKHPTRAFFGLSSNNEIKYIEEWYKAMLELEIKASTIDEFKKIAFFNHLIFKKMCNHSSTKTGEKLYGKRIF
jgi:hypothetical protein